MARRWIRRRREGGFTLLELTSSLSILLVGVMAAFSAQLTGLRVTQSSYETTAAVADLQTAMEQVLTQQQPVIPTNFPADTPIAAFDNLHLRNESIVPTYPQGTSADPLEIRLTIAWNDFAGRPRTLTLSSMKAK